MKKNLILSIIILLSPLASQSFAQDSTSGKPYKTKMFTISPGYAYMDVMALNQFLAPGTTGSFNNNFGVLGLQSTTECKRFIYGYTLQAGMSQKTTSTNYAGIPGNNMEYYASFGNLLIHGGYSIISTKRVKFYPIIGLGFGSVRAHYNRIDNQNLSQFANNPNTEGNLTKYMGFFDGALSLDLLIPAKRWKEDGSMGRVIGLRVGYTQGLGGDYWRFTGARILENPTYNPGMVYAKLQFGLYRNRAKGECYHGGCRR